MKILRIAGLFLLAIIIWLAVNQFFLCPFYSFPEPTPFSGNQLYNPYANADFSQWKKCNFHAHANVWNGLTNGHGTNEDVKNAYKKLGYDVGLVSNYQKIDFSNKNDPSFIPVYEHGNNLKKNHHLVMGDNEVTWADYIFPQTLSNKQNLINRLGENPDALVIINHPHERNAFTSDDVKRLVNYRCLEINSGTAASFGEWDAALSAGKPVFLAVNDDSHNVFKMFTIGRFSTWVNTDSINVKNIIGAMEKGCTYGVAAADITGESLEERIERLKSRLPKLTGFTLKGDTIELAISMKAKQIIFTGKDGMELSTADGSYNARYVMKPNDEYARATVYLPDGTEMYLNPVFRHNGNPFPETKAPVRKTETLVFRTVGIFLLCFWVVVFCRFILGPKTRRSIANLLRKNRSGASPP